MVPGRELWLTPCGAVLGGPVPRKAVEVEHMAPEQSKRTLRPRRPSTTQVPFTERITTTLHLPDGRAVDAEFEGLDQPPAAPFAGQAVTLWEVPDVPVARRP